MATAVIRPTGTPPPRGTPGQPTPISTAIPGTPSTPMPPTPTPTLPPDVEITLFGPPADGRFFADETIPFFWDWPLPLSEEQGFIVVVSFANGELQMGVVDEPNLGNYYRLSEDLSGILAGDTAVAAAWEVHLIHTATHEVLRRSPARPITLLPTQ